MSNEQKANGETKKETAFVYHMKEALKKARRKPHRIKYDWGRSALEFEGKEK